MPQFMDFHEDLKLPAEAIAQIAADTRNGRAVDGMAVGHHRRRLPPRAPPAWHGHGRADGLGVSFAIAGRGRSRWRQRVIL